jgi:hypothetical protein
MKKIKNSLNKALTQTRRQRLSTKANAGGEYSSMRPFPAIKVKQKV